MPFNKSTSLAISFIHIGFWLAFYLVPFIDPRGIHSITNINIAFLLDPHILINYFFFIFLFYANSSFFVTKYLLNKKYILYFIVIMFTLIFISWLSYVLFPHLKFPKLTSHKPPRFPHRELLRINQIISLLFPLFFILLVSTLYRLLIVKYKNEKKQKEKENQQLKTELSFLRSQISPHFIFNALNSSIILVRKQSEKAEEALIKLASLMRYMLYESDSEKITLREELEYLESYIDLQIIRFGNTVQISKKILIDESLKDNFLESMLIIPFIENAFKHGTLVLKEPIIEIEFYNEESKILLTTKNRFKIEQTNTYNHQKNNGIGLSNVTRRLELLYPSCHQLHTEVIDDFFIVHLFIDLRK